ncbi:MAG: hypothetical protein RBR47_11840 [Bacteroidales bacterium]|jgi:hypothetical protein|nr:hypothetical protein [Bacteroidales bacterium]NCU36695.1 hypothetical protein [Candidatus Falkowbacteria bacterium]MDD2630845.1 hypothetical protein [Bacteroidales bacterium]MDD4176450.1 hypothetical protein [Bacteroidales bacterium]MDD4741447.1 hypothetical protein [Bacteroidales bacterium]
MAKPDKNIFHYTAGSLMEILKDLPTDMPVVVSGYETGYENIYPPQIMKLTFHPESAYWDGQFRVAEPDESDCFEALVLGREERYD